MTQTEIHRFDYSKPPPGYRLLSAGGPYWWGNNAVWLDSSGDRTIAISDAWAHYKRHNDPPGLTVAWEPADEHRDPDGAGDWEVTLISPTGTTTVVWWRSVEAKGAVVEIGTVSVAARAAAWAWYDRRLALADLATEADKRHCWPSFPTVRWPDCLAWTDEQVGQVESWLANPVGGPPEVLGGAPGEEDVCEESGHVCTGCIGDGPCVVLEAEIEGEERDADEIAELEAEIDDEDEFMDDGLCSPMPRSESGDPTGRDWSRQVEEHNATTLSLLNFNEPPPGWIWIGEDHDQGCALAEGASSMLDLLPFALPRAWERYKLSHDPPGMWCGFSRAVDDLDNSSIRVGVHACGSRWELQPDLNVPYTGFTVTARAWAWAWYERRQVLMEKLAKTVADLREPNQHPLALAVSLILTNRAPFHRVLCWHNEWVDEVEAWIERPSSTVPEALR